MNRENIGNNSGCKGIGWQPKGTMRICSVSNSGPSCSARQRVRTNEPLRTHAPRYAALHAHVPAMSGRQALGEMAAKGKQLTGLPIVLMTSSVVSRIKADRTFYDAGPREFVWLMDNASFVGLHLRIVSGDI